MLTRKIICAVVMLGSFGLYSCGSGESTSNNSSSSNNDKKETTAITSGNGKEKSAKESYKNSENKLATCDPKTGICKLPQSSSKISKSYFITPSPVLIGKLAYGMKREFSFVVSNRGDKPLSIKKVRSSCSCMKVKDYTKTEIAPGTNGTVTGIMEADKKEGEARKVFYLHLSDRRDPIEQVYVKVEFVKGEGSKLVLSGNKLEFGMIPADATKRLAVLRLMNFGDQPLEITQILNNNPALTLKLDTKEKVMPHKGVTLRAWCNATKLKTKTLNEEIIIMTNSPMSPAVTVKATGKVK